MCTFVVFRRREDIFVLLHCKPLLQSLRSLCLFAVSLMIINCFNVKWAAKVQIVFAISAVVALVMIIGIGVYAIGTGKNTPSCFFVCFFSRKEPELG